MVDWAKVFGSYLYSGLYNKESDSGYTGIKKAALGNGLEFIRIDLKGVTGKTAFLKRVARALDFPAYFGLNWDAFYDSLTDLSWKPAAGYALLFTNAHLLAEKCPADMEIIRQIFISSTGYWKQKKVPCYIVLSE
jgi:hypothetical protein